MSNGCSPYTLIFVKKYRAGRNTLGNPAELGQPKLEKIDGVCVGSWDPYVNFLEKSQSMLKKNHLKINWG